MEKEKIYSLYNNKTDKKLQALAYSKEEIKEVSLEYLDGAWYEHDVEITEAGSTFLWNERPYKGKVIFGTKEEVERIEEEKRERIRSGKPINGLNSSINLR